MKTTYVRRQAHIDHLRDRLGDFTISHLAGGSGSLLWPYEYHPVPLAVATVLKTGAFLHMGELWEPKAHNVLRWVEDGGDRIGLLPNYDSPAIFWVENALFPADVDALRREAIVEEMASGMAEFSALRDIQNEITLDSRLDEQGDFWDLPERTFKVALQMHGPLDGLVPDCWMVEDDKGVASLFWSDNAYWHQNLFGGLNWKAPGFVTWAVEEQQNSEPFVRTKLFEVTARVPSQAVELVRDEIMTANQSLTRGTVY